MRTNPIVIVIGTSALIAVLTGETGAEVLVRAIARDDEPCVSAASLAEAGIVLSARFGPSQFHLLQLFIVEAGITVVPVDEEQAVLSVRAYRQYGRGKHRAGVDSRTLVTGNRELSSRKFPHRGHFSRFLVVPFLFSRSKNY